MRKEGLFLIATGVFMLAVAYANALWNPTPTVLGTTVLGSTLLNETARLRSQWHARYAPAPPIFTGLAVTFIIVGTVLIVHAKVRERVRMA